MGIFLTSCKLVETIHCPNKIDIYQKNNNQKSNIFTDNIYSCKLKEKTHEPSLDSKDFIQATLMEYFQVNKIGINDIQHVSNHPNQFNITLNQNEHIIKLPIKEYYDVWKVSNQKTINNIEQKWINSVNDDIKISNRMDAVHSVVF